MSKYTKHLFFVSLVLSFTPLILSILSPRYTLGEFYPFSGWCLFPTPMGSTASTSEYRLYAINASLDTVRLNNTESAFFDGNDKYNIICYWGEKIAADTTNKAFKSRLYTFATFIEPDYTHFLLVQETFNPQELDQKNFSIRKKIITTIK